MIVPFEHRLKFATLRSEIIAAEVTHCLERFRYLYTKVESQLLMFEHGASGPNAGGCGIDHAHLHLLNVPAWLDVFELLSDRPAEKLFQSLEAAWAFSEVIGMQSYLLVGTPELGFRITSNEKPIPSQLLRRRLADKLGLPRWDWRKFPTQESFMVATRMVQMTSLELEKH